MVAAAEIAADVNLLITDAGSATGADLLEGDLDPIRLEIETHFFGTPSMIRGLRPHHHRQRRRLHPQHPLGSVMDQPPRRRRLLRRQGRRLVAHQLPPDATRPVPHQSRRVTCRLHGHRHDRLGDRVQNRPGRGRTSGRRRRRSRHLRDPRRRCANRDRRTFPFEVAGLPFAAVPKCASRTSGRGRPYRRVGETPRVLPVSQVLTVASNGASRTKAVPQPELSAGTQQVGVPVRGRCPVTPAQ